MADVEPTTIIAAGTGLVGAIGTLWHLDRTALVERAKRAEDMLAAEKIEREKDRDTIVTILQECAELKGRAAALAEEVKHARHPN